MASLKLLALLGLAARIMAVPVYNDISQLEPRTNLIPGGLKLDFKVSRRVPKVNSTRLGKRGGIYEAEINHNSFYTIELEFGSQHSVINVDLDTGSSDLWVPTPLTNCSDCQYLGSYDPSGSSTSQDVHKAFSIKYGDNSTSTGEFYQDQIGISGVTVEDVIFAVVNQTTAGWGILGVGLQVTEAMVFQDFYIYSNFPQKLVSNGLISKNLYSLYLNSPNATEGSIIFGGIDSTKYTGPLVTLPLADFFDLLLTLRTVTAGNVTTAPNYAAVLDSGTSFTYLNKTEVDTIVSNFRGVHLNAAGFNAIDCSYVPTGNVTYSFGEIDIDVPLSSLIGPQFDVNGFEIPGCIVDVGYTNTELPPILGDNFLRYAYVVYDLTDGTILLAKPVPS